MKSSLILATLLSIVYCVDFDPILAEDIFQYSRVAYCKAELIQTWNSESCARHPRMQEQQVYTNSSHEAQGYCGYDAENDRVVVAIRGSDDIKNWYANINFVEKDYKHSGCPKCTVHKGFHNVYENLVNNLLGCAYTLTQNHPSAKVVVTGHSLGAAQAHFAAIEINNSVKKVDYFYIFGSPRVGNDRFIDHLEQSLAHTSVIRVSHNKDAVVHLPTQGMGFTHVGHEVFLKGDSMTDYKICYRDEDKCANQYFWPWQWNIKDHLIYYGQCSGCTATGCDKYM